MCVFCCSSNGVVNLSPDKKRVLAEAYSVLKVLCLLSLGENEFVKRW